MLYFESVGVDGPEDREVSSNDVARTSMDCDDGDGLRGVDMAGLAGRMDFAAGRTRGFGFVNGGDERRS